MRSLSPQQADKRSGIWENIYSKPAGIRIESKNYPDTVSEKICLSFPKFVDLCGSFSKTIAEVVITSQENLQIN